MNGQLTITHYTMNDTREPGLKVIKWIQESAYCGERHEEQSLMPEVTIHPNIVTCQDCIDKLNEFN